MTTKTKGKMPGMQFVEDVKAGRVSKAAVKQKGKDILGHVFRYVLLISLGFVIVTPLLFTLNKYVCILLYSFTIYNVRINKMLINIIFITIDIFFILSFSFFTIFIYFSNHRFYHHILQILKYIISFSLFHLFH